MLVQQNHYYEENDKDINKSNTRRKNRSKNDTKMVLFDKNELQVLRKLSLSKKDTHKLRLVKQLFRGRIL